MFCLVAQIVTGIVLAMHYQPSDTEAFNSIEHIRRDVNYGWMIRNFHSVGASMFFIAVYIHLFRGLYYGSYKAPREILWILGVIILLLMMATAFMGYTLPWGQMSFWGATVITNLFSALDTIWNGLGTAIVEWLWGGYSVSGVTLNRFYSLHYLLPFVLTGVVILHIWALHVAGQNNPTGLEIKQPSDAVPMHPYATSKDIVGMFMFLILFAWFVFFLPDYLGHADNYIEANPLVTPPHIVPEWYFLPFYAILRAFTGSFLSASRSVSSPSFSASSRCSARSLVLAFAPWLDTCARALGQVPADLQMVLLGVRVHLRGARLSRLAAGRRRLRHLGADLHGPLLPVLPRRHAGRRPDRDAEEAAALDHRGGARRRQQPQRPEGAEGESR